MHIYRVIYALTCGYIHIEINTLFEMFRPKICLWIRFVPVNGSTNGNPTTRWLPDHRNSSKPSHSAPSSSSELLSGSEGGATGSSATVACVKRPQPLYKSHLQAPTLCCAAVGLFKPEQVFPHQRRRPSAGDDDPPPPHQDSSRG